MFVTDYTGKMLEGRYRVIERIGKGGMGSIYLGKHAFIGRKVAIKILHSHFTDSEEMVARFYREARAAAAIGHRNIIEVLDVGTTDKGDPYLVMEYLEGENVGAMLERTGPIGLAAACGIVEPILQALTAAHREGIVHRDIKPDNIFLVYRPDEATQIKLIDFGISKVTPSVEQTKLTKTGHLIGTPAYMSPEQTRGRTDVDLRADIYAVGVILYKVLSGQLPFLLVSYSALMASIQSEDPIPPKDANPNFPAEAIPVVLKAMSREPADRYQDAPEMLAAVEQLREYGARQSELDHLASGITDATLAAGDLGGRISDDVESEGVAKEALAKIAAAHAPNGWAALRPPKQRRWPISIILALILLAAAGIAFFALRGPDEDSAPPPPPAPAEPPPEPAPLLEGVPGGADTVEIRVVGAPSGAEIYYDRILAPGERFRVRCCEGLVPFKVQAPGYEPYLRSLVPGKDQVVEVELVREKPRPDAGAPAATTKPAAESVETEKPDERDQHDGVPGKPGKGERKDGFIKAFD